jgi:hypothetical protein
MKKYSLLFCLMFIFSFAFTPKAHAEMPVKARAFLTIVGYGAGSGALIGLASMAFGYSTRAVAQGASLGLYGGIIFGSYILFSHHQKRVGSYDDSDSPYQESSDIYGDEYGDGEGGDGGAGSDGGNFFTRIKTMEMKFEPKTKSGGNFPPLSVNLLQYDF